jgi:cytoskeleton protein RodZ
MSSIGETLRRERLRQKLDLERISRELKISQRFLEAIEDERFDRLPAGVFAKSFVRQYAGLLGLDSEEMAAEVQRAIEPATLNPDASKPDLPPIGDIHVPRVDDWGAVGDSRRFQWSSSLPALGLLVVVLLVCSGVYAFWQRSRQPVTADMAPPAAPVESAQPRVETPAAPEPQPQAQASPAPTEPSAAPTQPAAPPPQPAAPPAAASPTNTAARGTAPVRVQVVAEEAVWVLARADGKYLFSGTLEAHESRTVEATERLTLRLGNAGGVSISLNGKPVGPVGPKGQVRELQFTSGGFQIVAVPKPSLPEDRPI